MIEWVGDWDKFSYENFGLGFHATNHLKIEGKELVS